MPSIADPTHPRRRRRTRRRPSPELLDRATDWLAIAVSLGLFVGLLWWMTVVASS